MFAISTSWMVTASIKLEATFFKSFSLFDKRGDIYAFRIVDDEDPQYLFKVGRTSRPLEERMIEWDRQCPSKVHIWHEGILVAHSHRVASKQLGTMTKPSTPETWRTKSPGSHDLMSFHPKQCSPTRVPTKMHVLWVCWYKYQQDYEWGWKKKRLPQLCFVPSSDPNTFGFVDLELVIWGAHLIPAFSVGVTDELLPEDSIAHIYESFQDTDYVIKERDWNYYNVNIFVDRDMFMRYRGGGIGHSTRDAMRFMEEDARHGDKPLPKYNSDTGELLSDDEEMGDDGSEGDGSEDDADEIVSQSSVESHQSVHAEPEDYDDTDPEADDAD
ncbi:hypothetical protein WG66_004167 [Moniliophthora roreri]|nr:hypothetical protein WG66_004167 [Moniliophthora roreri]